MLLLLLLPSCCLSAAVLLLLAVPVAGNVIHFLWVAAPFCVAAPLVLSAHCLTLLLL